MRSKFSLKFSKFQRLLKRKCKSKESPIRCPTAKRFFLYIILLFTGLTGTGNFIYDG